MKKIINDFTKMTSIVRSATVNDLVALAPSVRDKVASEGFVLIRGMFDRLEIQQKLTSLYTYANTASHKPSAGVSPAEIRCNMTKWSIGGHSQSQAGLPRFMLTVYNPLWDEDTFKLHSDFSRLIEIRDTLAGRETLIDDRLAPARYNGCRVQIYPSGGGFMGAHVDSRAASNLEGTAHCAYIQMVLLLTERGKDYQSGGAFVISDDKTIDSEAESLAGDLLVYDGSTHHGVADIDSNIAFDISNLRGRAVALVTVLTKDDILHKVKPGKTTGTTA
ncbi:hypothetical protein FAZ69_04930 [Trinickia terrae]|uniref:2OG-Fe(II) oxygenase n=1 Tax=Trinickia terrae TaxID=2571161 RepID=A0A4U1IE63_9BURK|nr:2OG-Fe(II) oxygenase [Trinickia terrae]TKC91785.1 hypothetical protein FAZ69_04930 [Trinickia terrae]